MTDEHRIAPAGSRELTMPDGTRVLVWERDVEKIKADVRLSGNVGLIRDPSTGVYDYVPWTEIERQGVPHRKVR